MMKSMRRFRFLAICSLFALFFVGSACGDSGKKKSDDYEDCYDCCEDKGKGTLNTMCVATEEEMCSCQSQSNPGGVQVKCPGICK